MTLDWTPLEKALRQLEVGLSAPPTSELERDGIIQRFEYCFELSWKSIRSLLLKAGRKEVSGSPRPLLKDALEEGLISDFKLWNEFLEARNESAHTYHLKTAEEVFRIAKSFPDHGRDLLQRLRSYEKKLSS